MLTLPLLVGAAWAGDPPPERVWSHAHDGETWGDYAVAIGNRGTQVFSDTGTWVRYSRLYSDFQGPAPMMLWEQSDSTRKSYNHKVDAAEESASFIACRQEKNASNQLEIHIEFFDDLSETGPRWEYAFAETFAGGDPGDCKITPDGNWIVAAAKGSAEVHVVVFEPGSHGTPSREFYLPLFGSLDAFEISDDATRVYVANGSYGYVYDLNTGAELFYKVLFGAEGSGHAFSGDGRTLVYLKDDVYHAWRDQGAGYIEIGTYVPFAVGSTDWATYVALSRNGNTLAGVGYEASSALTAYAFAYDVPTGTQLLADTRQGGGSLQNVPSDVAITPDGKRIVVGLFGDEAGLVPEIIAYERNGGSFTYLTSFDRPGSVRQLDLSANGKKLAISGRDTHANEASGTKVVEMFDLGSDLRVSGVPRSGQNVDFTFYANTGPYAFLLEGNSLAEFPRAFSIGTLYVQRSSALYPMTMNGGVATRSHAVTFAPTVTHYFQCFSSYPRKLSEDWVQVTALP